MDKSKAFAGGGAWMIAAALQVVPQTWPNLLHPHPWAVGIFILVGAAMFAYAAFSRKETGGPVNSVGRDNSGHQINNAPGGTVIIGDDSRVASPQFQYIPGLNLPSSPLPAPSPPPSVVFHIELGFADVTYAENPGIWKRLSPFDRPLNPRRAVVVSFARRAPAKGSDHRDVSVRAILDFTPTVNRGEMVPYAYWLDLPNHDVLFGPGHKHEVMVGALEGSIFSAYENPYRDVIQHDPFAIPVRRLGPRKSFHAAGDITVNISLFEPRANQTIEEVKILISFKNGGIDSLRAII